MALECELKYVQVDLAAVRDRLVGAGATSSGPYFESNTVFDRPDRSLKAAGILLRLRQRQGVAVLTVKRPPATMEPSLLKVFNEIETKVADPAAMGEALTAVGFIPAFSYEKVREKWRFMDCTVCLDRLPFGDFVEIEGGEATVPACAEALDLDPNLTTKATYHGLNIEYRHAQGLESDENFIFDEAARASLGDLLGKV